jgi:hypothetical protein
MKKYNDFFKNLIKFLIEQNISIKTDFVGLDKKEVVALEANLKFKFGNAMRSYLNHFGEKLRIPHFDITRFNLANIKMAEEFGARYKSQIKATEVLDGWNETKLEVALSNICLVNYYEPNHYFYFISEYDDESILYGWEGNNQSYKYEMSIPSNLRASIYSGLKSISDLRRESNNGKLDSRKLEYYNQTMNVEIQNLDWLGIYADSYISNNTFVMNRYNLEKEILQVESIENRLIGINEYGDRFQHMMRKDA